MIGLGITHHHYFHPAEPDANSVTKQDIADIKKLIMSLQTELDQIKSNLDATTTGIASLNQKVTDLQTALANASGSIDADSQAKLDALVTESTSLAASFPAPAAPAADASTGNQAQS